jgi:hypothetical protein
MAGKGKTGITMLTKGITEHLEQMVKNANLVPGYLNRVVYRKYQNAQRQRWASENADQDSAGGLWPRLSIPYAEYKMRTFYDYPGRGQKMMIRTKALFDSVVGPSPHHGKVVTNRSIRIESTLWYAKYADEARTFSQFSPRFYRDIYAGLRDYLTKGLVKTI